MIATWEDIQDLRSSSASMTPEGAALLIQAKLTEIAGAGDRDARAQLCIDQISQQLAGGDITSCEAFARALDCLAHAVVGPLPAPHPTPTPAVTPTVPVAPAVPEITDWSGWDWRGFLDLAWAYLVPALDQSDGHNVFSILGVTSLDLDFLSRQRPRGGYPRPDWTNTHDATAFPPCSGWMTPIPGDPGGDANARSGHTSHFLAGALLTGRFSYIGDALRKLRDHWSEDSTTDMETERLGAEFGSALNRGQLTPANIAEWFRKNLCTETLTMSLLWTTNKGPHTTGWDVWAVDAKSEYHDTHFELSWRCAGIPQKEEWDATVFVQGGTGFLAISDFRQITVNLGEHPTREDLIEWAKSESGLEFRDPPPLE
ncbi:MAG TPA: hypothetical protein VES88_11975 [Gemmatimonadaceae bacterium]|nr:hypothetical protein [Gemmatimonadaceae bacterium]